MPRKRWRVDYDLAYDFCASGPWSKEYRTLIGAVVARFWNLHISSWGGKAVLVQQY